MINAVNVPVQTVAVNSNVLFQSTRIRTGCSARHEQGSGRFVALKPGVYQVTYGGNVSIPTDGTVAPIILDLLQDGEAIAGGRVIVTPTVVDAPATFSRTVLVKVFCDCCVSLSVRNSGTTEINVQDASFVITREC